MSLLLHGDCLEHMKGIDDESVDFIFCDLPYGQTSCKWDCKIDLEKFWIEVMRIKKLRTPIFMTTTTKFGVELISSAPKKCPFRYDLVWVKSAPAGFLSAKKMPMRKHEMVYVFYEKLPLYDLSSHQHKFIKEVPTKRAGKDGVDNVGMVKNRSKSGMETINKYDPPLPVSVVKENLCQYDVNKNTYGGGKEGRIKISKNKEDHQQKYDPPLPTSVVKEPLRKDKHETAYGENIHHHCNQQRNGESIYDPPLPVSVVKEECKVNEKYTYQQDKEKDLYGTDIRKEVRTGKDVGKSPIYDPPLPVSVLKEPNTINTLYGDDVDVPDYVNKRNKETGMSAYDPPLPTTMLEIKSTRGKHSTEKPVALMEWLLKYFSKEGDVVLDPTMGSGSTGVACKNMNRNFIGIELDPEIYEVAVNRIND
jgi:hypothetical protein